MIVFFDHFFVLNGFRSDSLGDVRFLIYLICFRGCFFRLLFRVTHPVRSHHPMKYISDITSRLKSHLYASGTWTEFNRGITIS
jgi:hypothetical protein